MKVYEKGTIIVSYTQCLIFVNPDAEAVGYMKQIVDIRKMEISLS